MPFSQQLLPASILFEYSLNSRYTYYKQKFNGYKEKNNKPTKADMALSLINKLYRIEREVKESSTAQKYQIRQEKSLPQLKKLRQWTDNNLHKVPGDS